MSDAVISVRNLSKAYSIYESPRDLVKELVFGGQRHDVFWALKDISLDVLEGQRLGIVGPNGAGKSTLLRLITGNLNATGGSIAVNGRVSAMLSLTSFLNPDETGLENIRFSLLANGAARSDIPRLTEEIIDFTELGAFIQAPVRTYSSGMNARLAFAISTVLSPDILIVDEVLAAGDAYFVGKATQRMVELCRQGRALLFVSHSPSAVQLLCNTALWLDGGQVRELGPVDQVLRAYEDDFRQHEDESMRAGNRERRAAALGRVRPEEFVRDDVIRFRITGEAGQLRSEHYVRSLTVALGGREIVVPLEFAGIDDEGVDACLDVLHSEWGRPHTRRGSDARTLAPSSHRLRGGHVLVNRPLGSARQLALEVALETSSGGDERLIVEAVDAEGTWVGLGATGRTALDGGWERATFSGEITLGTAGARGDVLRRLLDESLPDIEIVSTTLVANGRRTATIVERRPFEIEVHVRAHRPVPLADVGIKIIRSDGVYVFWQSSGETGGNLVDVDGEKIVSFRFDPNLLGAGHFEVTTYAANGFDLDRNYPYSEVFDRRVNSLGFTVVPERVEVDYGAVNQRVEVTVRDAADSAETAHAAASAGLGS